ncbi:TPA: cellulase family glycosylhydrolase [Klebsiella aerogenes]|uniref:cellulase family glycosylhydrolase n=1 Tax=Klebsiella aerogenes TaxID=548 RepID=UPI00069B1070|nr:cellulase family glycosylhydrolase [Klebsiella aerogenes]MEB7619765.1 cellulase family glycosylhydrolase [Klebsiella aerogenes]HBT3294840.1 cellulase family glycosylhydrolase [Klebsiella aerogenes]HDT0389506.1 cellulase family glycosylhydrolase [Klebsiella aerogenes]HEO9732229.1 cellulase family glycosylhydrolase [Klebsiella aerogenes]
MVNIFLRMLVVLCVVTSKTSFAFILGVGIHTENTRLSPQEYLEYAKRYGFNSIRTDFFWSKVEHNPGVFNEGFYIKAQDYIFNNSIPVLGNSSMIVLDYGNSLYTPKRYPESQKEISAYVAYATRTVQRYKGKVLYYEVWNEWLQGTGVSKKNKPNPDPKVYTELVKQTYKAIKAVDPTAIVTIGSINPNSPSYIKWLNGLINEGILDYCDAISVHTYFAHDASMVSKTPEGAMNNIDKLETFLRKKSGRTIDLYITEMGYSQTESDVYSTEDAIFQNVAKFTLLARSRNFIKGIWWYDLINDGDNKKSKEDNFGFLHFNKQPKNIAQLISSIAPYITNDDIIFSSKFLNDKITISTYNKSNGLRRNFEWVPYGAISKNEVNSYIESLSE